MSATRAVPSGGVETILIDGAGKVGPVLADFKWSSSEPLSIPSNPGEPTMDAANSLPDLIHSVDLADPTVAFVRLCASGCIHIRFGAILYHIVQMEKVPFSTVAELARSIVRDSPRIVFVGGDSLCRWQFYHLVVQDEGRQRNDFFYLYPLPEVMMSLFGL